MITKQQAEKMINLMAGYEVEDVCWVDLEKAIMSLLDDVTDKTNESQTEEMQRRDILFVCRKCDTLTVIEDTISCDCGGIDKI